MEKILITLLAAPFAAVGLIFVVVHVVDSWDAPEYPHSGFCPDSPTWEQPNNTLAPTYSCTEGTEF